MMKKMVAVVLCLAGIPAGAQMSANKMGSSSPDQGAMVPLSDVLTQTKEALDIYGQRTYVPPNAKCRNFLPLASAAFNFRTVVDQKMNGGLNLYVFSVGASKDNSTTATISFVYTPPIEHPLMRATRYSYYDQILAVLNQISDTIIASNGTYMENGTLHLPLTQVEVTLDFAVTTDKSGGMKLPWSFVTVSGGVDKNSASTQEVKLIFKADGKLPLCAK